MAKVRCPCGRDYNLPDAKLGARVKCRACERVFVAEAVAAPAPEPPAQPSRKPRARAAPAPAAPPKRRPKAASHRRHRVGDLAVARGFITRKQLNACLQYQKALQTIPHGEEQRLGQILYEKGLLTRAQLESLIIEQTDDLADAFAAAASDIPTSAPAPARAEPLSDEQRQLIRDQVQAARRPSGRERRRRGPRIRRAHVAIAAGAVLAVVLALLLWPAPRAERVLVAYLEGCKEQSGQPSPELALLDIGLVVTEYGDVRLLPIARYDYSAELAALGEEPTWEGLLGTPGMPPEKTAALALLVRALGEQRIRLIEELEGMKRDLAELTRKAEALRDRGADFEERAELDKLVAEQATRVEQTPLRDQIEAIRTPQRARPLAIATRQAVCALAWKRRGAAMAFRGRCRFLLLKIDTPIWKRAGWLVASFAPVGEIKSR